MENTLKIGLDMIYLANCALWDVTPQESVIEAMDLSAVYALAKKQSMPAVTYYGIEKWVKPKNGPDLRIDADLLARWQQTRDMAIRKNTMLDIAREQIFSYMEEHNIWHMPLKGSLLKELYPRLGMRQMADNDILIDAAYRKHIYAYMISLGYKGNYHESGAHDEFLKKPFYNFEIHNSLIFKGFNPVFEAYYRDIKEKLIKDESCRYRFRDEDFYIYMMVHAYKHHSKAGNGVRHLMDVQVYLDKTSSLDWDYIHNELIHLGIFEYEATVKSLSGKLFDKSCRTPREIESKLDTDELDLLGFSICAGTYGTPEIRVENDLQKFTQGNQTTTMLKLKYLWYRLTCDEGLYYDFPKLANYSPLHPFLYIGRAIKIIFLRRKNFISEIRMIKRIH